MSDLLQLKDVGGLLPGEDADCFRERLADLLRRKTKSFPGAQPVSFARKHLQELRKEDYFLCEKTDGIRCLLYLTFFVNDDVPGGKVKANFLIDRKNDYYFVQNPNLNFPLQARKPDSFHTETVLDGELVLDTEKDGSTVKRYLVFDCLAIDGRPLLDRSLSKRMGYVNENVLKPYNELLKADPGRRFLQPFEVLIKNMEKAYGTEMIFRDLLPALKHGNDGLVFTCVGAHYVTGTDPHIIKWKPPHENTIDFRLQIGRFPPLSPDNIGDGGAGAAGEMPQDPDTVDYDAVPQMSLLVYHGGRKNEYFADLHVTDSEWAAMKSLNQMLDGRIIECYREPEHDGHDQNKSKTGNGVWRPKTEPRTGAPRFRDDKTEANHISTVNSVLESIEDAVSEADLRGQAKAINVAWKEREKKFEEERRAFEAEQMAARRKAATAANPNAAKDTAAASTAPEDDEEQMRRKRAASSAAERNEEQTKRVKEQGQSRNAGNEAKPEDDDVHHSDDTS